MSRTFASAVTAIASTKVVVTLLLAIITPILVRLLGAAKYGEYATVMAVFGLLMILASSGVTSGVKKYLSEQREIDGWRDHVFGYYFRVAALFAMGTSVVLLVFVEIGLVDRLLGAQYARYFYLLAVLALAAQFREFVRQSLRGLKLEHQSEPLRILHKVSFGIGAVGLAYLGYGVVGILVGHIFASTLVILAGSVLLARHLSFRGIVRTTPEGLPTRELLNFNNLSIVYFFLLTSLYHVDVLMLDVFHSSEQVGYYKGALVIAQFLWFVPKSIQAVMIQSTADLWAQEKYDQINSLAASVTRYTLVVTVLLTLGLAALAGDFVPIYYGPDFEPAVLPLLLLLPGTLGFALARPVLAITHAKGAMNALIGATAAAAILNLLLNLLLIPPYGMAGAAVATSIGYGSLPIFQILAARRIGFYPLADLRLPRLLLTAIVSGAGIYWLATSIASPWLSLFVVPPAGFALFALLTVATGTVERSEVFRIAQDLPSPIDTTAVAIAQRFG